MALNFQPYASLSEIQSAQPPRPNVGAEVSQGLQGALGTYLSLKQKQDELKLAQMQRNVELAKAVDENGQDFLKTYSALGGGSPGNTILPPSLSMGKPATQPSSAPAATPSLMGATPNTDAPMSTANPNPPSAPMPGAGAAPTSTPTATPAPLKSPLDITPEHLAQIRQQRGSKGLKEFQDQQNFLLNQQQGQAQLANMTTTDETKLRDDYTKASANFKSVAESLNTIKTVAAQPPSTAGDISLLFNYMKMVAPEANVREGQYATAENSGTIPERLTSLYNKLLSGKGDLSPSQREDFVKTAGNLYQGWQQKQTAIDDQFRGIATRSRLNPENVLLNYGINNPDMSKYRSPGAAPMPSQTMGDMVPVIAPDGKTTGRIPRANLQRAMDQGYKVAQ